MFITLDFVPLSVSVYRWNPAPPSFLPTLIECFNGFPHLGQLSVFVFPRHLQRGHFSNSRATASPSIFIFRRSLLSVHRFHLSRLCCENVKDFASNPANKARLTHYFAHFPPSKSRGFPWTLPQGGVIQFFEHLLAFGPIRDFISYECG
jgi:hypothetical protein